MGPTPRLWLFVAALAAFPASAQNKGLVVRDGTLGGGPPDAVVPPGLDDLGQPADYLIRADLGEQRGGNLFHSFSNFSIGSGERATFTGQGAPDPGAIDNVISRVTGRDESRIDGELRSTIPGADVWLLNPSGVVFGEGAKLDVPGSFHASTGDYVGFGEGDLVRFHADPSRPSVLSTARPEAFGFLGESAPGPISVTNTRLDVEPGEAIDLAGGDVTLTSATLDAPSGAISIHGGRIVVAEGSKVLAENDAENPAGTIAVEASESLDVDNSLLSVNTTSSGDAGTIRVRSPRVTFRNGPGFQDPLTLRNGPHATEVGASAETSGSGAGGAIGIEAGSLTITEGASLSARTFGLDATGDAGTIELAAGSLDLSARSDISAGALASQGDAGEIDIDAGRLTVDGAEEYAFIWTSSVYRFGNPSPTVNVPGAPGRIAVTAGSVELVNGGGIQSLCWDCTSRAGDRPADAATIRIEADQLLVAGGNEGDRSYVSVRSLRGDGDAGTLVIDLTGGLELLRGGGLFADSSGGSGKAGHIQVRADSALISEAIEVREFGYPSGILVSSESSGGKAGTVDVAVRTLAIEAGGHINANSITIPVGVEADRGGNAGTIRVTASESISVSNDGGDPFSLTRALLGGLQPTIEPLVVTQIGAATVFGGQGGSITLEAPEITVSHGALVGSSTVGGGDGGSVLLEGANLRVVDGGLVNSASLSLFGTILGGQGGDVELRASESIQVSGFDPDPRAQGNRSTVNASTLSAGPAGSVTLHAPRIVIDDGGIVQTGALRQLGQEAGNARGGDITLAAADEVIVRSGGLVDASSFVPERAGNIVVTAGGAIRVEGEGSRVESRTGGRGPGGNVSLRAPRIEIADDAMVSVRSAPGYQGVGLEILANDNLVAPAPKVARGPAGRVALETEELRLFGGTLATNSNAGDGGNIEVRARTMVLEHGSRTVADAGGAGSGGNIRITADNYFAFPGSVVDASSDLGIDGVVEVHTPDVNLAGALASLPTSYLDAASLMKEPCAARRSGERAGSFAVRGPDGIPPEPDGWLPASPSTDLAREPAATNERLAGAAGAARLAHPGCRLR